MKTISHYQRIFSPQILQLQRHKRLILERAGDRRQWNGRRLGRPLFTHESGRTVSLISAAPVIPARHTADHRDRSALLGYLVSKGGLNSSAILLAAHPFDLKQRRNNLMKRADGRKTNSVLQQCRGLKEDVVVRDDRLAASKPFHPDRFGSQVVRIVAVEHRVQSGRVGENSHWPNASARYSSCRTLTSVSPEENRPATRMALATFSSRLISFRLPGTDRLLAGSILQPISPLRRTLF